MSSNQGIVGVMMLRGHITAAWIAGRAARNYPMCSQFCCGPWAYVQTGRHANIAEDFRIPLAFNSGVQGKLMFRFSCMGLCTLIFVFLLWLGSFFLNWQEPMAAVDNRLRHIYPHVIATFCEYRGQAPLFLTRIKVLLVDICCTYWNCVNLQIFLYKSSAKNNVLAWFIWRYFSLTSAVLDLWLVCLLSLN